MITAIAMHRANTRINVSTSLDSALTVNFLDSVTGRVQEELAFGFLVLFQLQAMVSIHLMKRDSAAKLTACSNPIFPSLGA